VGLGGQVILFQIDYSSQKHFFKNANILATVRLPSSVPYDREHRNAYAMRPQLKECMWHN